MRLATERGYCDRHLSDADRHGWDARRGTAAERGYGWQWVKLRQKVLARDAGLCQLCIAAHRITPASEVDHILPKSAGGSDAMDNLQAVCRCCHHRKTIAERRETKLATKSRSRVAAADQKLLAGKYSSN